MPERFATDYISTYSMTILRVLLVAACANVLSSSQNEVSKSEFSGAGVAVM